MVSLHYGLCCIALSIVLFVDIACATGGIILQQQDCNDNQTCMNAASNNRKKNIYCDVVLLKCSCKPGFNFNGDATTSSSTDCWQCEGKAVSKDLCESLNGMKGECIVNEKRCGCVEGYEFIEHGPEGNRCEPIGTCPLPPDGTETIEIDVVVDDTDPETATYNCTGELGIKGNLSSTSVTLSCGSATAYEWEDLPECVPRCQDAHPISNGEIESTSPGEDGAVQATYKCNNGFVLEGPSNVTCSNATGWMFDPLPKCTPIVACYPSANWTKDHNVESRSHTAIQGERVVVYCNPCHEVYGRSFYVVVCSADGIWIDKDEITFNPHGSTICTESACKSNSRSDSSSSDDGCGCDCNCC